MADVAKIMPEVRAIQAPAPLRDLPGWCMWRYEQYEGDTKPRKVPYYHSGTRRRGQQGSPADRDQLTTFAIAREAAARKGFDGVGFALLADWGLTALDFDRVVQEDGSLPPEVEQIVSRTYAEYSPSGTGIRAFVRGHLGNHKDTKSAWGLETFSTSGFVTITGNILDEVDLIGHNDTIAPIDLPLHDLCTRRFGASSAAQQSDDFMAGYEPPLGLQDHEVQDLLDALDPDCGRDDWVRVGMALHHEFQGSEDGFQFWDGWSVIGGKYPGEEALRAQWDSFTRRMGPGRRQVTMASVIKMAKSERGLADNRPLSVESVEARAAALTADLEAPIGARTPDGFEGKFPVVAAADMVATKPSDWLIKGILPKADLGALYGASGSGKSFVSLDMAMHIALGREWRGHRVKQGLVVIVTAEGGGSYGKRIKAYCQHHEVDVTGLPLGIINAQPNILEAEDISELTASLRAMGQVSLLIIDTLAQVTPGANENTSEDMGRAIANAQLLRRTTGAMVLLIHHSGKDAARGARGWSGLKGALDVEIEVTRDEDLGSREIRLSKMKDEEDGLRFGFALDVVTVGMDEDGDEMRSCVAVEAELQERRPAARRGEAESSTVYEVAIEQFIASDNPDSVFPMDKFIAAVSPYLPAELGEGHRDTRRQNISKAAKDMAKRKDAKLGVLHSGSTVVLF